MKNKKQTIDSFGNKWESKAGKEFGLSDYEREICYEQLTSLLGTTNLSEIFTDNLNVLDAGCGSAWIERFFNYNDSVNWYAVDISSSVVSARENTKNMKNVNVYQSDLFDLPFDYEFFDVIISNGVLHHTGNAAKAFDTLCKHLKPKGFIGIYIYCKKPFLREIADKEIRKITTDMSFDECKKFSRQVSELGKVFCDVNKTIEIKYDIPLLGIKSGEYDLQKFIYDHFIKCFYKGDIEFSTIVNVDWYHPKYVSFHTIEEIKSWFEKNNIKNIKVIQPKGYEYSGYFVSGRKISDWKEKK